MKKIAFVGVVCFSSLVFADSTDVDFKEAQYHDYDHRLSLGVNSLSYEYIKPDDVFVQISAFGSFRKKGFFGASSSVGYNFAPKGAYKITPYVALGMFSYDGDHMPLAGAGVSFNYRKSQSFSTGAQIENISAINRCRFNMVTIGIPFRWHLGEAHNFIIGLKPYVAHLYTTSMKSGFLGAELGLGVGF